MGLYITINWHKDYKGMGHRYLIACKKGIWPRHEAEKALEKMILDLRSDSPELIR